SLRFVVVAGLARREKSDVAAVRAPARIAVVAAARELDGQRQPVGALLVQIGQKQVGLEAIFVEVGLAVYPDAAPAVGSDLQVGKRLLAQDVLDGPGALRLGPGRKYGKQRKGQADSDSP